MSDSFVALWTVDHQAHLSMEFPRQEYCSGLLLPTPGDLPNPGIEPVSLASPALAGSFFLPLSHQGNPLKVYNNVKKTFRTYSENLDGKF